MRGKIGTAASHIDLPDSALEAGWGGKGTLVPVERIFRDVLGQVSKVLVGY